MVPEENMNHVGRFLQKPRLQKTEQQKLTWTAVLES